MTAMLAVGWPVAVGLGIWLQRERRAHRQLAETMQVWWDQGVATATAWAVERQRTRSLREALRRAKAFGERQYREASRLRRMVPR